MSAELPDEDHVVRFVKPSLVRDDVADASAFLLRKDIERGLSVNWLEAFGANDLSQKIQEVRQVMRLGLRNGRFAKLNVGHTKHEVRLESEQTLLTFKSAPKEASEDHPFDPSHAEIHGLPEHDDARAMFVGQLIANCVEYPLIPADD